MDFTNQTGRRRYLIDCFHFSISMETNFRRKFLSIEFPGIVSQFKALGVNSMDKYGVLNRVLVATIVVVDTPPKCIQCIGVPR